MTNKTSDIFLNH